MIEPLPSASQIGARHADFATLAEALDYAAGGRTGLNFYSGKGDLIETLSYRRLREEAAELARRLLAAGLEPGDRVGLIADNDPEFVRAFFACQYAGLVPAPLPLPAAFGGRQNYLDHVRRMIEGAAAAAAFAPSDLTGWLDEAVAGLDLRCHGRLADLAPAPPGQALPEPDADGLCYLQFSSGSTRFPLGIAVTQRAFMANAAAIGRHGLRVREGDRCLSWLPFYHDMGLVGFLLVPVTCQLTVDLLPTREFARRPLVWLDLAGRNKATITYSPSFGFELCARRAETTSIEHLELSALRAAGIGGDMIRPHILAAFAERFAPRGFAATAFVPSYGMAEATLALSFAPLDTGVRADRIDVDRMEREGVARPATPQTTRPREFVLCGPPLPLHEIAVRDEDGAPLGERRLGRIFARGPSLMLSYYGRPQETAEVLSPDGWLDTGDLGYWLDGQIVVTGRAKDLIIVNGRNIWPQDLEWTAESEVETLRSGDVAVFSLDEGPQEVVHALVQCRPRGAEEQAALAGQVSGVLRARHGVEARVILVPPHSLPKTSSGKLSRSRAKALYLAGGLKLDAPSVAG